MYSFPQLLNIHFVLCVIFSHNKHLIAGGMLYLLEKEYVESSNLYYRNISSKRSYIIIGSLRGAGFQSWHKHGSIVSSGVNIWKRGRSKTPRAFKLLNVLCSVTFPWTSIVFNIFRKRNVSQWSSLISGLFTDP